MQIGSKTRMLQKIEIGSWVIWISLNTTGSKTYLTICKKISINSKATNDLKLVAKSESPIRMKLEAEPSWSFWTTSVQDLLENFGCKLVARPEQPPSWKLVARQKCPTRLKLVAEPSWSLWIKLVARPTWTFERKLTARPPYKIEIGSWTILITFNKTGSKTYLNTWNKIGSKITMELVAGTSARLEGNISQQNSSQKLIARLVHPFG